MATNYERLIKCSQKQLEYFFDSLVHKPASAYVDWASWLDSEDPEAPYIGEEAFYLDNNGDEKSCRFLEELQIGGEKHRTIYDVLEKGEIYKESLPAHLVRLASEEEYPEEDPLRRLISDSVNEYTTEQNFNAYLFANPGSNIEAPKQEIVEDEKEEALDIEHNIEEAIEETVNEEEVIEAPQKENEDIFDIEKEINDFIEEENDELVVDDEVSEDVVDLDESGFDKFTTDIEKELQEESDEEKIEESVNESLEEVEDDINTINIDVEDINEDEPVVDNNESEIVLTLTPEEDLDTNNELDIEEDIMNIDNISDEDVNELSMEIEELLNRVSSANDELNNTVNLEEELGNNEETIIIDTVEEIELPEAEEELPHEEATIVVNTIDDLKEDNLGDELVIEDNEEVSLEKELESFENTLSELTNATNEVSVDPFNSQTINLSQTIHEYED